ncbi:metal-binding, possibly nucleic acid-binding protein, partial [gut metagenome]
MQFDLKRFMKNGQEPYRRELECELSEYDWPDYKPQEPIKAVFEAVPTQQGLSLCLSVEAVVEAMCARCLEPISKRFQFTRKWNLR